MYQYPTTESVSSSSCARYVNPRPLLQLTFSSILSRSRPSTPQHTHFRAPPDLANSRGLSPTQPPPNRPSFLAAQAGADAPQLTTTKSDVSAAGTVAAGESESEAISPAAAALETLESPVISPRTPQEHQQEQERLLAASRRRRSQHPVTPGSGSGKGGGAAEGDGGDGTGEVGGETGEAAASVGGVPVERKAGEGRPGAAQAEDFREGKGTSTNPANRQEERKGEETALVHTAVAAAAAVVALAPRTPAFHRRPPKPTATPTAEAVPISPVAAAAAHSTVAASPVVPSPVAAIAAAVATAAAAPAAVLLEGVLAVARSARPAGRRRRRQSGNRRSAVVETNWAGDRSCVLTVGLRYHLSTFDAQGLADMLNSREESTERMAGTKASFFFFFGGGFVRFVLVVAVFCFVAVVVRVTHQS